MSGEDLTPREIVAHLDAHIVGQARAKRAVAIALRNRWRRQRAAPEIRDEIIPRNILMIGPTGVGKTEIARRLAKLAHAPFVKVEASKFTEVGYVGRDVESMVKDLADAAYHLAKADEARSVEERALAAAEDKLLGLLATQHRELAGDRASLREAFRKGELDEKTVEIDSTDAPRVPSIGVMGAPPGMEDFARQIGEMFKGMPPVPGTSRKQKVRVPEAFTRLRADESSRLLDPERLAQEAVRRAEQSGIVFIDEIDKVASPEARRGGGPDVSREGVQRDLLPIVEGSTVQTRHGPVRTDHVLFIAAGAFHVAKPSDLLPELQGRFPIRVELEPLGRDELPRILREPQHSLLHQASALLGTEGVTLRFTDDGIDAMADAAAEANRRHEDIGARRLHTVLEAVLEEISFETVSDGSDSTREIVVDRALVAARLQPVLASDDLSRFIL